MKECRRILAVVGAIFPITEKFDASTVFYPRISVKRRYTAAMRALWKNHTDVNLRFCSDDPSSHWIPRTFGKGIASELSIIR